MKRQLLIPSLVFLLTLTLAVSSASASPATLNPLPSNGQTLVPGNYCISCHLADDPRLGTVTAWKGNIGREVNTPCPAATRIHEELYYTERLLLMIDRAKEVAGPLPEKQQVQLDRYTQQYSRLIDEPVTSLDAFVARAQTTRYRLNKIYASLNQIAEANKKRTVLIYAGIATLIVLASLAWGLYNTRSIASGQGKPKSLWSRAIFVVFVLAFFVLPIFRVPAAVGTTTTVEQQAAQAVLDTADRAAVAADRAQARAWLLARLGVIWDEVDPTQVRPALEEAIAAVEQARENEKALWGQSLAVQEAMIGVSIDMEKADVVAVDVNAARRRAWSLPWIAIEWGKVDSARAKDLPQGEQDLMQPQMGIYRDLQMRLIALAWAQIQPMKAIPTAGMIHDPSVRSWTLRELGAFDLAVEAAREVADPVQRARALRELGVVANDRSLFREAFAALDGVKDAALAYALSDLFAATGESSSFDLMDDSYPDAQVAALLRFGDYVTAQSLSALIIDPYEQARAQAAIAARLESVEALKRSQDTIYRDLALRDIARATGNAELAASIKSDYYRVQAFTALGDYEQAIQFADRPGDSYPLIELASALVKDDAQAALALVEKMTSESDKAIALRAIALATDDPEIFELALGMAQAARVRGDSLAPAQASLDLADALWASDPANAELAFRQAYEAAQRISTK